MSNLNVIDKAKKHQEDVNSVLDEIEVDLDKLASTHIQSENNPKYTVEVKAIVTLNNKKYKEFEELFLKPKSRNNKIRSKTAETMWTVFVDSEETMKIIKLQKEGKLNKSNMDLVNFWANELSTKSVDELHSYGPNLISFGLGIIVDYLREWLVVQKYEKIYSKKINETDDMHDVENFYNWCTLYDKNEDVYSGKNFPYNMEDISRKAKLLLTIRA